MERRLVAIDVLVHRVHPLVRGTTLSGAGAWTCVGSAWPGLRPSARRPAALLAPSPARGPTAASALGRCATIDHDPAARAHAENGLGERLLAFGIEIGIGLVEHDQERLAVERARERDALPLSGGQRRAALADLGLVAVRQVARSARARRRPWRRRSPLPRSGPARSGRCSAQPFRRTARHPAADSRCGGRAPPASIDRCAAPSSRTLPRTAGHTPTIARTSDDLPEALGPTMPSALPAFRANRMSCTTTRFCAGRRNADASSESACAGGGSSSRAGGGRQWRPAARRAAASPAAPTTKPFQLAMARSIGARARPARIELAMMMPAVASCWITR